MVQVYSRKKEDNLGVDKKTSDRGPVDRTHWGGATENDKNQC